MDGHFSDLIHLINNGQNSELFAPHFKQHFKSTTSRTDLSKCMAFKVENQLNLIGAMKTFTKPNCNLCMEERLTILKKLRDKRFTLMNENSEIYRACRLKTTFCRFFLSATAWADDVNLRVTIFDEKSHLYYHELIQEYPKAAGHTVTIETLDNVPQNQVVQQLDQDKISLHWLIQSASLDSTYTPVEVGITNTLIGHRVLFIPKGGQFEYDSVKILEDFRNLGKIGVFDKKWFDVSVWK